MHKILAEIAIPWATFNNKEFSKTFPKSLSVTDVKRESRKQFCCPRLSASWTFHKYKAVTFQIIVNSRHFHYMSSHAVIRNFCGKKEKSSVSQQYLGYSRSTTYYSVFNINWKKYIFLTVLPIWLYLGTRGIAFAAVFYISTSQQDLKPSQKMFPTVIMLFLKHHHLNKGTSTSFWECMLEGVKQITYLPGLCNSNS